MSMRNPAPPVMNDKIVWIKGSNGVCTPKWLSKIQGRVDCQILGDYKPGDQCYDDPKNKPKPTKAAAAAKKTEPAEKE